MRRVIIDLQRIAPAISYQRVLMTLCVKSKQTVYNLTKSSIRKVANLLTLEKMSYDEMSYDDAMRNRFWLFALRVGRAISEPEEQ